LAALAALMFCAGCGYRAGNISGREIQGVRSVYVPTVKNETIEPGLQTMTTSAIIRRFDNDGTLETLASAVADSELEVTIKKIRRIPQRQVRENVVLTSQYEVLLEAEMTFVNRRQGRTVYKNIPVTGETTYFVTGDMQENERQALPLAAEDLAKNIVKQITEGW
jgi:hypothetical protein